MVRAQQRNTDNIHREAPAHARGSEENLESSISAVSPQRSHRHRLRPVVRIFFLSAQLLALRPRFYFLLLAQFFGQFYLIPAERKNLP
jgi:hypothetical protein